MAVAQHVVEGKYPLGTTWAVTLPARFEERVVEDTVILSRPGLTMRLWEWQEEEVACCSGAPLDLIKADLPETAYAFEDLEVDGVQKFAYRVQLEAAGQGVGGFHGYVTTPDVVLEMTADVADEAQAQLARQVWLSLSPA
jgi:hypothetical protein